MSPDYFYGTTRKRATKQAAKPRPNETRGKPATGKIAKLLFGQAYGFIKMRDNREVYFHRADVQEGTSFNDLEVGETVKFELLDDAVSGARALRVRRNKSK
jgi:cold shock CspA family protein